MLVAVFRAKEDGDRTAERLWLLGHEALLAPVIEIVATGAACPPGPFDAVIFTSAHAVNAMGRADVARLATLPCFCVGSRTAARAEAAGFADVRTGEGDAAQLASLVGKVLSEAATLLFAAGRDRKPGVERRLERAGHRLAAVELYDARAVGWQPEAVEPIRGGKVSSALHYSRRSAELALRCAAMAEVMGRFTALRHHCLSRDVAMPLVAAGCRTVIAGEPSEDALLATLPRAGGASLGAAATARADPPAPE